MTGFHFCLRHASLTWGAQATGSLTKMCLTPDPSSTLQSNFIPLWRSFLHSSRPISPRAYISCKLTRAIGSESDRTPGIMLAACASKVEPQRVVMCTTVTLTLESIAVSANVWKASTGTTTRRLALANWPTNMKGYSLVSVTSTLGSVSQKTALSAHTVIRVTLFRPRMTSAGSAYSWCRHVKCLSECMGNKMLKLPRIVAVMTCAVRLSASAAVRWEIRPDFRLKPRMGFVTKSQMSRRPLRIVTSP